MNNQDNQAEQYPEPFTALSPEVVEFVDRDGRLYQRPNRKQPVIEYPSLEAIELARRGAQEVIP